MALYCAEDSFATSPMLLPFLPMDWALVCSELKTVQEVEGASLGLLRSAFAFKSTTLALWARTLFTVFCFSVRTFLFDLGFAASFFLGLRLVLSLALDLPSGTALDDVFFGAGFLAALVAEVVGALLPAALVLPV